MRVPPAGPLLLAVALVLAACNGADRQESEAVGLWKAAVWEPTVHAPDAALRAAETSLEAPDELPLDDVFVFTAVTLSAGDLDRGTPALHVLADRQPDRPGVLLLQGLFHSVRHDRQDAMAAFDACVFALASQPEQEPLLDETRFLVHLYRGQEHYLRKRFPDAVADLERALEIRAGHATGVHRELLRFLADAHVHIQQYEPAEEVLRGAIAADPDFPAHHFQLGAVLAAQVRTEEAAGAYRRCVELAPGDPVPRLKLAEIARRDGDLPAMRAELDALLVRVPEGALGGELSAALGAYQLALGGERAASGDEEGARAAFAASREHLLRAVETNPLCTRSYTLLVQVAALLGAPDDEIDGYKRRLEELEHARSGFPAAADPHRTFC